MAEQNKHRRYPTFVRGCRLIHRHLSYLFAGVVIIYALSGILMNHRGEINPHYSVARITKELVLPPHTPREAVTKERLSPLLEEIGEGGNYTKHYFPQPTMVKVFLKGGSTLEIDLNSGTATYDRLRRRPLLSAFVRLHYNPGKWWTYFSDIFAIALVLITLTGLFLAPPKKGLRGAGAVEFVVGLLLPLLFLFKIVA